MTSPTRQAEFSGLLDEHRGALRKVVLAYGTAPEDREDLAQEIRVQLWRSFGRYDPRRAFATWMYRVALNVAISHVRRRARKRSVAELTFDPPDPRTPTEESDDRVEVLQRLLRELDELDRALLLLHLEERSYREIAEVLGLSESNVGTKLHRLREKLRRLTTLETKR